MAQITDDEFDEILCDIVNEEPASRLLFMVPGVYALVAEHYNNDVLDRWKELRGED